MTVRGHVSVLGYQCCLFLRILKVALSCWNYSCCFYYHLIFPVCIYLLYLFILFIYFISYVGLFVLWCFNSTFNKFSVFSWRSVLLVEETGEQGENQLNFLCTSFQSSKVFESFKLLDFYLYPFIFRQTWILVNVWYLGLLLIPS